MRASTIVLICLTVTSTASATWLGLQLREERTDNEILRTDLKEQQRLLRSLPAPTDVEPPPTIKPSQGAEGAPPPPKSATPFESVADATPPGMRARDFNESRRKLLANPDYRKALRTQQRVMMEQHYRDLPRALGLSPEKASQFYDQLADNMMQNFEDRERRMAAQADGSQVSWAEQNRRREEAAMLEVLGADGMQKFREYNESMMSHSEVRMLGAELIGSPDPLREDQMQPLFDLIYAEQKRLQQEWSELPMSGVDGPKLAAKRSEAAIAANQRILDSASSVLSGTQLAALKEMYRRQRAQMESQDEMNRLMTEAMSKQTPGRID